MPNKTQEYLNLAQQTAKELTRYWENWTDYLTTASRLYKYSFADQLMIYAQRPDATACASFDIWNNRMNRYVRRGSKGIALLDQSSSVPCLHYVFDVSDTGVRRNSRDPEVWQLGPDLVQPVSEMLAREYGVYHERLSQQISDLTGKLVDSYWDNNSNDILNIINTVYSNIHTRVNEIGMQRAIGMSAASLYKTFLWEGAYYAIFASVIGAVLGYVCCIFVGAAKTDALQLVAVPVIAIIEAAVVSVAACLLATAIPLHSIAKMNIVESIENVE